MEAPTYEDIMRVTKESHPLEGRPDAETIADIESTGLNIEEVKRYGNTMAEAGTAMVLEDMQQALLRGDTSLIAKIGVNIASIACSAFETGWRTRAEFEQRSEG